LNSDEILDELCVPKIPDIEQDEKKLLEKEIAFYYYLKCGRPVGHPAQYIESIVNSININPIKSTRSKTRRYYKH
jgi:hypothetical protein